MDVNFIGLPIKLTEYPRGGGGKKCKINVFL